MLLPDHRARPGRRHRAGPRLADAGSPLTLGSDQHAVIDPFEELRGLEMHERLATGQRGRFSPAELVAAAGAGRLREPGMARGRPDRRRCSGRLRRGRHRYRADLRMPSRTRSSTPPRPPMSRPSSSTAGLWCATARMPWRRSPLVTSSLVTSTLVTGIGELVTCDGTGPDRLGIRHGAALVAEDGRIAWIGSAERAPAADHRIDVAGRAVVPGFVDAHSHLVFAGDRGAEFAARMAGVALRRRRHRVDRRRHPSRRRRGTGAAGRRPSRRDARPGHHALWRSRAATG